LDDSCGFEDYKKVLDNYAVKIGRCKKKIFLNPQLPQQDFSKNKNAKMRKCENARIQREYKRIMASVWGPLLFV
jgi:hypothetical protein